MEIRKWSDRERLVQPICGATMAQQQFKDECDINNIMSKYQKTGLITHVAKHQGDYDDFTVMPDFKTAIDTIHEAERMFMTLPSNVREQFENDAGQFVEFATNDRNYDEMVDLGLIPVEKQRQREADRDYRAAKKSKKKSAKSADNPPEKISEKPEPSGEEKHSPS